MTKVINYQRISTGAQDAKRQTYLAKEYCNMYGYELVDIISEQVSGAKADRKSIDKLLSLTNKDCDLVVVSELSRLTREEEYDQIIYYIKTIKKNSIDIVFLDEPNTIYKHDEGFH
ncbi:recombinase family protein [Hoylesella timonensis]|uniref:recombinase family protein n=1 Tax=Hoylesella timonensis TaxID=386414 RepID=UPI00336A70F5